MGDPMRRRSYRYVPFISGVFALIVGTLIGFGAPHEIWRPIIATPISFFGLYSLWISFMASSDLIYDMCSPDNMSENSRKELSLLLGTEKFRHNNRKARHIFDHENISKFPKPFQDELFFHTQAVKSIILMSSLTYLETPHCKCSLERGWHFISFFTSYCAVQTDLSLEKLGMPLPILELVYCDLIHSIFYELDLHKSALDLNAQRIFGLMDLVAGVLGHNGDSDISALATTAALIINHSEDSSRRTQIDNDDAEFQSLEKIIGSSLEEYNRCAPHFANMVGILRENRWLI